MTAEDGIDEPGRLADTVAAHMALKLSEKQRVLEIQDVKERLEQILGIKQSVDTLERMNRTMSRDIASYRSQSPPVPGDAQARFRVVLYRSANAGHHW